MIFTGIVLFGYNVLATVVGASEKEPTQAGVA